MFPRTPRNTGVYTRHPTFVTATSGVLTRLPAKLAQKTECVFTVRCPTGGRKKKLRVYTAPLLNETLYDSTVSDSEIVIDDFYIIRNDRSRYGGGVAVYVSNKFIFKRRHDLESDVLENVWVELQYSRINLPY